MMQFIHIPKNAGTTVSKMLGRNGIQFRVGASTGPHTRHWYARQFTRGDLAESFAIVRNPYTRVVSYYEWIRRRPKYRNLEFDEFVLTNYSVGRARTAWQPQWDWIHSMEGEQLVKHILRYETLEEDLIALFPTITGKFKHLNSSGIKDYDAYYSALTRDAVAEWFSIDFMTFGYKTK